MTDDTTGTPREAGRPGVFVGGPNPVEARSRRRSGRLRAMAVAVAAPVAVVLIRAVWLTYRFRVEGDDALRELVHQGRPVILTCWHEGIFVLAWYLGRLARLGAEVTYLISPSRDGDLGARMVQVLGGRSVRGSATRSGVKAMRGLYRAISRDNASPVVLPDGPTGPRRVCKQGSLLLAQLTGAHVVPIACDALPRWRLRTWDRMLLPPPFARIRIVVGAPYTVANGLGADQAEIARRSLETQLDELGRRAAT